MALAISLGRSEDRREGCRAVEEQKPARVPVRSWVTRNARGIIQDAMLAALWERAIVRVLVRD